MTMNSSMFFKNNYTTEPHNNLYEYELQIAFLIAWISVVLCFLILLLNGIVLFTFIKDPLEILHRTPSNYLVLSLVISDIFSGLVVLPLCAVYNYLYSRGIDDGLLLTLYQASSYFSINVSTIVVVLISLSQYIAVKHPLKVHLLVKTSTIILFNVVSWIYAFLFSLMEPLGLDAKLYFFLDLVLHFFIPMVLLIILGALINKEFKVYMTSSKVNYQNDEGGITPGDLRVRRYILQQKQLCTTILLVVCTFVITWAPYLILQTLAYYLNGFWSVKELMSGYYSTEVLAYVNCALNPCIYALKIEKYRCSVKSLMRSCSRREHSAVRPANNCHVKSFKIFKSATSLTEETKL